MDIVIKTLTGTIFELKVSPFETVLSIKVKLQRLEDIPVSQQHLIWRTTELHDDYCLHDYGIKSGASLTLVLAMRDGPINMRRVSVEDPTLEEMAEYMDANRDEIWDKIMNDDKQVTLLVFRDGDQLNFFRVYDRGDGTLSPYSQSLSPTSAYNVYQGDETTAHVSKAAQKENVVTKNKMQSLRDQLEAKSLKKNPQPRPPSAGKPCSKLAKRRIHFSKPARSVLSRHGVIPKTESKLNHYDGTPTPDKQAHISSATTDSIHTRYTSLPPVHTDKDSTNIDVTDFLSRLPEGRRTSSSFESNLAECNTERSFHTACSTSMGTYRKLPDLHRVENNEKDAKNVKNAKEAPQRARHRILKPLGSMDRGNAAEYFSEVTSPTQQHSGKKDTLDDALRESRLSNILRDPTEYEKYKQHLSALNGTFSKNQRKKSLIQCPSRTRQRTPDGRNSAKLRTGKIHPHGNLSRLPSVHAEKRNPPSLNGKKKTRCSWCTKKLGLATTYQCRCGHKFCATHRYPETHTCTYDYKTEGRKLLEKNNPVVTAPKLPKI